MNRLQKLGSVLRGLRASPCNAHFYSQGPRSASLKQLNESFAGGSSGNYLEQMYLAWQQDPNSVHASWNAYFSNVDAGTPHGDAFQPIPSGHFDGQTSQASNGSDKALALIQAYEEVGHYAATVNPLYGARDRAFAEDRLDPATYGLSEDMMVTVSPTLFKGLFPGSAPITMSVKELKARMDSVYCGDVGYEYMHITNSAEREWLRSRIQQNEQIPSADKRRQLHSHLLRATVFEQYLHKNFQTKRFGLDGAESLVPGMMDLVEYCGQHQIEDVVIGMPHRGRLNVLANVCGKPIASIIHEFDTSRPSFDDMGYGSGDMKYHLGAHKVIKTESGNNVELSLAANPSHLEAVGPVVLGKVYAKMRLGSDEQKKKSLAVLLHGDASFSGQGIVQECFDMSELNRYYVGGTVHIVVNNQIGFTTDIMETKRKNASKYSTDVAKMAGVPIIHVNGDNVDALHNAMKLAIDYRQEFGKDVVIDLVGYRRYGHNELDQPMFTQPLMYDKIKTQRTTLDLYSDQLVKEGVLTSEAVDEARQAMMSEMAEGRKDAETREWSLKDWIAVNWDGVCAPESVTKTQCTGLAAEQYDKLAKIVGAVPEGFTLHNQVKKVMEKRRQSLVDGEGIDWGTAEAMAFGSLVDEGNFVRISGEDVERGTFSHRHAALVDQKTGAKHYPLQALQNGGQFEACSSNLSEYGVLGFDLGVSMESAASLVVWEAQFGDFANGAQIIIDQFVTSGESKWNRQTGLVMLLPHGYDGLGPEHSSARLERFLQMSSDEDSDISEWMQDCDTRSVYQDCNIQVCNITSPANYFHALRRQLHRSFRKPLVVMSPKRGLRHPLSISRREDFLAAGKFKPVLSEVEEGLVDPNEVRRVILCSGNVYFDLFPARSERNINDVAIVRLEQIAPFPHDLIAAEMKRYPNAEVMWVQEEPKNMGAWSYVKQRIDPLFAHIGREGCLSYAGRKSAASTATGSHTSHDAQLKELVDDAFSLTSGPC